MRCIYGVFGREITKYAVIYIYRRLWPTLVVMNLQAHVARINTHTHIHTHTCTKSYVTKHVQAHTQGGWPTPGLGV